MLITPRPLLPWSIRRRAINAVAKASLEDLEGVLSILESEEVGVEPIPPARYAGLKLTEGDLAKLRSEREPSVFATKRPGATARRRTDRG